MGSIQLHLDGVAEERREGGARFAMKLPATARLPGQPRIPARLLDISRTGCRLLAPVHWPRGTAFWLTISGLPQAQFCSVMWSHDRFAGIRFAIAIEEAQFDALLALHGRVSETEAKELKALSDQCAQLARGIKTGDEAIYLSSLARDCDAEAVAFEQMLHAERMEAIDARTRRLLSRLSVRDPLQDG
jgi:hypothetical protein